MKRCVLSLALVLFCGSLLGEGVVRLVEGGVAQATLVLGKRATTAAQFGALEVQHHIRLISGAELPIVREGTAFKGYGIYVGDTEFAARHGLQGKDFKLEESLVSFVPGGMILLGRDSQYFGRPKLGEWRINHPGIYYYHKGSLYAAYDLLEEYLGVRWYAPGEDGIAYVPRKTVEVAVRDLRRQPAMKAFRNGYLPRIFEVPGKQFPRYDQDMLRLRWRGTWNYGACNHNVYSVWYRYWGKAKDPKKAKFFVEKRPEYFAHGYKGISGRYLCGLRKQYPGDDDLPPQLCNSNEDVIRHFAREAAEIYAGTYPSGLGGWSPKMDGTPWFYPIEPDDNSGFCLCEACQAQFKEQRIGGRRPDNYIHFNWISRIAREAATLNPKIHIATLAYNNTLKYPKGLDIASNVGIMPCVMPYDFWVEFGGSSKKYQEWIDHGEAKKRMMNVWTYSFGANHYAMNVEKTLYAFPMFAHTNMGRLMKKFVADGMQGWFGETSDETNATFWHNQLETYLCYKLAYDPSQSVEGLVEEFFRLYYGHAAAPMRTFYELVEQAVWVESKDLYKDTVKNGVRTRIPLNEAFNWGKLGTPERMASLAKLMKEAVALAQSPLEKRRMNQFVEGLWKPMLKGRANYDKKLQFMKRPVAVGTVKRVPSAKGDALKVDWKKTATLSPFKQISGFPCEQNQTLKMVHDGQFLYLQYDESCDTTKLESKTEIWNGDELEFFFAAEASRPYLQLAVNPAGTTVILGNYYKNMVNYSSPVKNGTVMKNVVGNGRWTFYASIPLKDLVPERSMVPGDGFRFNVFRGMPKRVAKAWSPAFEQSFHVLERMGKLTLER